MKLHVLGINTKYGVYLFWDHYLTFFCIIKILSRAWSSTNRPRAVNSIACMCQFPIVPRIIDPDEGVIRVRVTRRLWTGLTWQADFGDRRLIGRRRLSATREKQVCNCVTNGCTIFSIVWSGFSSSQCCHSTNIKQVLLQFSELVTGQIFYLGTLSFLIQFWLTMTSLSEVILTLCSPLKKPDETAANDPVLWSEGLSCTLQMRWGNLLFQQ